MYCPCDASEAPLPLPVFLTVHRHLQALGQDQAAGKQPKDTKPGSFGISSKGVKMVVKAKRKAPADPPPAAQGRGGAGSSSGGEAGGGEEASKRQNTGVSAGGHQSPESSGGGGGLGLLGAYGSSSGDDEE